MRSDSVAPYKQGVGGSSPPAPTTKVLFSRVFWCGETVRYVARAIRVPYPCHNGSVRQRMLADACERSAATLTV